MKKNRFTIFYSPWLHLFLLAIYPILFMYAYNIVEVRMVYLILPVAIMLSAAGLLAAGLAVIIGDGKKAALSATLFIFFFYGYSHITGSLEILNHITGIKIIRHVYMLPLFLAIWMLLTRKIARSKMATGKFSLVLNIAAIMLIAINVFNIASYEIKHYFAQREQKVLKAAGEARRIEIARKLDGPDIYYIILDEYAGYHQIEELYAYDNQPFVDALRRRGFYVALDSKAGFLMTEQNLASILNMRPYTKEDDAHRMVRNNRVTSFLKQLGYKIITFPLSPQTIFVDADVVLRFTGGQRPAVLNGFYMLLLEHSMLKFLHQHLVLTGDYSQYYRDKINYVLETVQTLPPMAGPKFVYVHINCPHYPFVFDENGNSVPTAEINNLRDKRYYLGQYKFINKEIIKVIDTVMADSSRPPVIILQSDHGQRGAAPGNKGFRMEVGEGWKNILNGFYFPDGDYSSLNQKVSPMETFAILFEKYFEKAGTLR